MTAERVPTIPSSVVKTLKVKSLRQERVDNLVSAIRLDQSLSAPIPGVSTMPSALTMRAKIQKVKDAHALSLVALDAEIDAELKSVAEEAARTVGDVRTALKSDVAAQRAEISALRDELNQMTNGGPPLSESEKSQGQSGDAADAETKAG